LPETIIYVVTNSLTSFVTEVTAPPSSVTSFVNSPLQTWVKTARLTHVRKARKVLRYSQGPIFRREQDHPNFYSRGDTVSFPPSNFVTKIMKLLKFFGCIPV